MQYIGIETSEMQTERWDMLCEYLDQDKEPLDKHKVLGHLTAWYLRWGGDQGHDSGLLWAVTPKRMGVWAGHERPEFFGNGLVHAGYVEPIENVYPVELLAGRTGYCVRGTLDRTWVSIHSKRVGQCADLALFLLDREARSFYALKCGSDLSQAPPDWLDTRRRQVDAGSAVSRSDVDATSAAPAAPPAPHVDVSGGRPESNKQRNNVGSRRTEGSTGNPKTPEQLALIREFKYSDPLRCCMALDETPWVVNRWRRIHKEDRSFLCTLLANVTDTDEGWAKLDNPSAVVFSKVLARLRELDGRRNDGNDQRGGRGGRP